MQAILSKLTYFDTETQKLNACKVNRTKFCLGWMKKQIYCAFIHEM